MEEFEKLDKALRVVERYEDYLFRRAMGIAFIVNGFARAGDGIQTRFY